jgi:uridine kinase
METTATVPAVRRSLKAFVVSVSGTSGAGKTTVIEKAAALLPSVAVLRFDDYITLGNDIAQIRAWVDAGADLDEIKTPMLAVDLRKLSTGEAIRLPETGRRIEPADFIILEEPFGRSRLELSPLIDFAVFIEAPPDIALARRTLREIETWQEDPARLIGAISIQLQAFIAVGRDAYLAAARAARQSADIVLDGLQPIDALAAALVGEINRRA